MAAGLGLFVFLYGLAEGFFNDVDHPIVISLYISFIMIAVFLLRRHIKRKIIDPFNKWAYHFNFFQFLLAGLGATILLFVVVIILIAPIILILEIL